MYLVNTVRSVAISAFVTTGTESPNPPIRFDYLRLPQRNTGDVFEHGLIRLKFFGI